MSSSLELPLLSRTPLHWAVDALRNPIDLLVDHAFLEKKAANNAMEMMTRWPGDWHPEWVEIMTSVARDEAVHLAQVSKLLIRRGGRLSRMHKNTYANALRQLVRKGEASEAMDRLFVSALIECRSCERFGVLAEAAAETDAELSSFYRSLFASEFGHYKVFLKLAAEIGEIEPRWSHLLDAEARIIATQPPGPRIHSGVE